MNSSVVKISETFYVDERDISAVYAMDGSPFNTCVIVKGAQVFTETKLEDILKMIHWSKNERCQAVV